MAVDALIESKLEEKRPGYDVECTYQRFTLDLYTGGGGFQGRVKQPLSSFWGPAADLYSGWSIPRLLLKGESPNCESYLDQFPREDEDKFRRRQDVARYPNYARPTTDLKVSFLLSKPFTRTEEPEEIKKWRERTNYDAGLQQRALMTAVFGYFPLAVEKPAAKQGAQTAAQAGDMDPYVVPHFPCEMLKLQKDQNGDPTWITLRKTYTEQPSFDADEVEVKRYTVWEGDKWRVFESRSTKGAKAEIIESEGTHPFKQPPVVFWRASTGVDDKVKADCLYQEAASTMRGIFNKVSELDEHRRSQVFALLINPVRLVEGEKVAEVGNENGLIIDPEQKNVPYYLAPPEGVAKTILDEIAADVVEVYRMLRVEYVKATGANSSASSKQQEFQPTNLSIANFGKALAEADLQTLRLVGRGLGVPEEKLQKMGVHAAESYDTAALNEELENIVVMESDIGLGPTFSKEVRKGLAQRVLSNASASTMRSIESEIDELVDTKIQEAEIAKDFANKKAEKDLNGDGGDPNDPNDPNAKPEDDGTEEEQQAAE